MRGKYFKPQHSSKGLQGREAGSGSCDMRHVIRRSSVLSISRDARDGHFMRLPVDGV